MRILSRLSRIGASFALGLIAAAMVTPAAAVETRYNDFAPLEPGIWRLDMSLGASHYKRLFGTNPIGNGNAFDYDGERIKPEQSPGPSAYTSYVAEGRITYESTVFNMPARLLYSLPLRNNDPKDSGYRSNLGFDDANYGFTVWPYSVDDDETHLGIGFLANFGSGHVQKYSSVPISNRRPSGSLLVGYHYRAPFDLGVQLESVFTYTKFGKVLTDLSYQTKKDLFELHQWANYNIDDIFSVNSSLKLSMGGSLKTMNGGLDQKGSWRDYNNPNGVNFSVGGVYSLSENWQFTTDVSTDIVRVNGDRETIGFYAHSIYRF
ncbi:MAG: hypothetical protein QM523_02920 [Candidatus Pacebacteria bacterium]|nr:hypothetical protein [Candidatus Paceibacterota bacterium]